MEQSEKVSEIDKRVASEARSYLNRYRDISSFCASTEESILRRTGECLRPLVERILELESINRAQEDAIRGTENTRNEAWREIESLSVEVTATRDELTIERHARQTADALASRQTERINALEVRAAEAEEQARATSLHWQQERAEVSNLRGILTTRDMLLRAADKETEAQTAYGAKLAERFEEVEARLAGMTGERDEERALKARYGVALEQAETKRRAAEKLVEMLRGAMRGMAVEWARDIARDERRVCGGGQS